MGPKPIYDYSGSVVVVTGAARGIGREIARQFCNSGAHVVLVDLNGSELEKLASNLRDAGGDCTPYTLDLGSEGDCKNFCLFISKKFGHCNVLINNARPNFRENSLNIGTSDFDQALKILTWSPYYLTIHLENEFKNADWGSVVNISSISSTYVSNESIVYQMGKAALNQLTRSLAVKLRLAHVRVNAVLPGMIVQDEHRDRYNNAGNAAYRKLVEYAHPLGYPGASSDVANACLFLSSAAAKFINGHCLVLDGGLMAQDVWAVLHNDKKN